MDIRIAAETWLADTALCFATALAAYGIIDVLVNWLSASAAQRELDRENENEPR